MFYFVIPYYTPVGFIPGVNRLEKLLYQSQQKVKQTLGVINNLIVVVIVDNNLKQTLNQV